MSASSDAPIFLDYYYESTKPGRIERRYVETTQVPVDGEERESIRKVVRLLLQARLSLRGDFDLPCSLDRQGDLNWHWMSHRLSSNAYGRFAHVAVNHPHLRSLSGLSYDWIPDDNDGGMMTIRKKCAFQSLITQHLASEINNALHNHDLVKSLNWNGLQPQTRASVLVENKLGMRTPCRSSAICTAARGDHQLQDDKYVWTFVLEVGMAEKSENLPAIAQSYIQRGTLSVMTVDIRRSGNYDFTILVSIYRRGEKISETHDGVLQYDMVESSKNVMPEAQTSDSLRMTLFDFFRAEDLGNKGLTAPAAQEAFVMLSPSILSDCLTSVYGGYGQRRTVSGGMERLEHLLSDKQ